MKHLQQLYIGSYNHMSWCRGTPGEGLYHAVFDSDSGEFEVTGATGGLVNPSFSAFDAAGEYLYTINEVQPVDEQAVGRVTSFAVDAAGNLTKIGECPSYGLSPCYLVLDEARGRAFLTDYCSACAVAIRLKDHVLGGLLGKAVHTGCGPDADRQEAPHPHSVALDAAMRHLAVADLGIDRVVVYRIESDATGVTLREVGAAVTPPGSGPRHLLFDANGRHLYSTCEMGSMMCMFDYDAQTGALARRQTISTVPAGQEKGNCCAHLMLSKNGRFLYASNRGNDSIAVFAVADDGTLSLVEVCPSGGETPRNFSLDPTGRWLIAANQDSDCVAVFAVDEATGRLTPHARYTVPSPVHVLFRPGTHSARGEAR